MSYGLMGEFLGNMFAEGADLVSSCGQTFCKPHLEACNIEVNEVHPTQAEAAFTQKPAPSRVMKPFV